MSPTQRLRSPWQASMRSKGLKTRGTRLRWRFDVPSLADQQARRLWVRDWYFPGVSDFQCSMFRFVLAVSFSKSCFVSFRFAKSNSWRVCCRLRPLSLGAVQAVLKTFGLQRRRKCFSLRCGYSTSNSSFCARNDGFPWFYIAEIASVYLHVPYPQLINHAISKGKSPHKAEQHNYLHVFNEMQGGFPC